MKKLLITIFLSLISITSAFSQTEKEISLENCADDTFINWEDESYKKQLGSRRGAIAKTWGKSKRGEELLQKGYALNKKLDNAKKSHVVPLFCPKCKKVMNKGMDPSYYQAVNQCFSCFKKFETQLKATGLWEEWEKKTINGNIDSFIVWYKDWVMDSLNISNN